MKTAKKRTIYCNFDLEDKFEYIKDHPEEFFMDYEKGREYTDDEIWDEVNFEDELEWDEARCGMKEFFTNPNGYVITGTLGLWNGSSRGGKVFTGWEDLWNSPNPLKDCDYFDFYDVNGHFYIKSSHHDGTNHFEVKALTDRGRNFYENNTELSREEVCEKLMNDPHYSKLPRFAEKVFGCPAREYV